jgi:zinc/manganese transport system substrate-binding protein
VVNAPARLGLALALVVAVAAAGGCGTKSDARDASVNAVATTTQVADLVRNVGGDRVAVDQMLEPNSDPHGYEPRPSDAAAVAQADVVFRSGGDVDGWLGDVIDNAGGDAQTVDLGEEIGASGDDPHWWQDPRNAIRAVARIEAGLSRADPAGRERYRANARAYSAKLRRLDRGVAACIGRIPSSQRKLVTTHDALGYYADRYGIEVVGALIPSLSSAAQPSAGDVERLVDQIERLGVQAIFPESSLNPKLERAVARETGASVGRALWADTLGPDGSSGDSYIKSIESNTAALVDGLTGGRQRCTPGTRRAASRRARQS